MCSLALSLPACYLRRPVGLGLSPHIAPRHGLSLSRGRAYSVRQPRGPVGGVPDARVFLQTGRRADDAMWGPQKESRRDELFLSSLEQRLPASNFYRQLDAKLDLSVVRDW